MRKKILIVTCFLCLSLIYSCNDESHAKPTDPDINPNFPEGTFDYSKVLDHPRLLMSEESEEELHQKLEVDEKLKSIHDYILSQCNLMIGQNPLVYKKEGKRLLAVSREALKRIFYLSYGYRMTGSQLYLIKAKAELNAICDFSDWNPSHFLDVGEMCMAVSIGYDWLYDELDDALKIKIQDAIVQKAFNSSKVSSYNWFYDRMNNWNQVCNAGLVYGALAILEEEPSFSVEIIEKALETNRKVLDIYAPDGNYPEGAGYWAYGTTFQVMMIAGLESAFEDDAGLSMAPGFMKSAEYMLFMNSPSGQWFNYSDCGRSVQPLPAMFWFANKENNASLLYEELKLIEAGKYFRRFEEERILPLVLIFGKDVQLSQINVPSQDVWSGEGSTPITVVRRGWSGGSNHYVGIKGGSASTSHAHMDAGSFVYDIGDIRWAMDLGMQSYGVVEAAGIDLWNMGQNSERWDVFRLHNKNHNTISINNQRHNVNGFAPIVEIYESNESKGAKVDLTDVLNLSDELVKAHRTVTLENNEYLKVVDILEAGKEPVDVYWNMVTQGVAEIVGENSILISKDGKEVLLEVESTGSYELETNRSTVPHKDYESSNPGTIMLGFKSTIPAYSMFTYTVSIIQQ